MGIALDERSIPVHPQVSGGCSFLGLDPLCLANEGKCLVIVPEDQAARALEAVRGDPQGREACRIGTVTEEHKGRVYCARA